jgi:predicted transcriptional regulator
MPRDVVAFTFWAPPELKDGIKRLSKVTGRTMQELMVEALEDFVSKQSAKHGWLARKGTEV